jgi:hypothetical protein
MSHEIAPLTAATLPPRIRKSFDRALGEAADVIQDNVEAYLDRSAGNDGPPGADGKGRVNVKVTLTLTITHDLEHLTTSMSGTASITRPKARAKGAPLMFRAGELQVELADDGEVYDPRQERLDLGKAEAPAAPLRVVEEPKAAPIIR